MINNLGLYNTTFNNNSTVSQQNTTEIQAITEKHAESIAKSDEPTVVDNSLYLSSRAQKINAISSEFFNGVELTFDDIGALKEKLYQFGLISKSEYASLNDTTAKATNNESSEATLTNFLGDFIERLNKDDSDENADSDDEDITESETIIALTGALTTAKEILKNVEEQKQQTDFKTSLKGALVLLKETINDKSFEELPLDDKIGLSKVHQALEIVDKLSQQRLNNDKVNQYIKLAYR